MTLQFGLDVPIHKEFSNPELLSALAVAAERTGWDGFFLQDAMTSPDPLADPWIALTLIAVQTHTIRLGVLMTALPRRRPWKVARETATIDQLSHGRLIFGAGLGFNPHDFSGFGEDPAPAIRAGQLDEGLTLLDQFWRGEEVTFTGIHYQVEGVTLLPRPVQQPRIPIWVGGGWPRPGPFRRAARWDGIYVMTEKATGGSMQPADIQAMIAFITQQQGQPHHFEVAFAAQTPADPLATGKVIKPYGDAGVTWWLEGLWSMSPAEAQQRVRSGPPVL